MIRLIAATLFGWSVLVLTGCAPSYSPDTYATNAAQQANKVEAGVIAGVRPVRISAAGTVGGVAGAAAGGVAGAQAGAGPTSAFGAIGGSLVGGLAGVATEHIIGDTDGFEYIVRKANGEMIGVAQKDEKPLWVGEKVLVIAGPQARVVPDYTVPFQPPPQSATPSESHAKPAAGDATPAHQPSGDAATTPHPPAADAHAPASAATSSSPSAAAVSSQLPAAFAAPNTLPTAIIVPPEATAAPTPALPSATVPPATSQPGPGVTPESPAKP